MDQRPSCEQPPVTSLYMQATLEGGAPWDFSLKGGLEHGQPLTISKVQEGRKIDMMESHLQVGDEVMMINGVELTSSRKEAISLVKGSYKSLQLVVRRIVPENGLLEDISCLGKEDFSYGKRVTKESLFIEKPECLDTCLGTTIDKPTISFGVCPGEELKLSLRNRQSVSIPRPHSWHSSKLLENQPNPSMMQISQGTIGSPWLQAYHSSSSASDLSNYEHGYLRRSPDQYSSRGSMESLEHTSSSYHPCHLSPAKSTNSIDQLSHLHNKRDSAYSSFSTNSSIPEYQPIMFCKERSYSMENMLSRGNLHDGIKHADIKYIKTVYDSQRGVSEEYEVNSSLVKHRAKFPGGCSRNSSSHVGRLDHNRFLSESEISERSPPMPPTRSDSYAVTKHHERPSSWSSLDQHKSFRTHSKGPGPPMAFSTSQQQKPMYVEGQLHTVMEKSPECSPIMKPKQMYSQILQPGQPMLPAGIYPVPSPEPHFAHAPQPLKNNNGRLYPALAKEGASSAGKVISYSHSESNVKSSQNVHSSSLSAEQSNRIDKKAEDGAADIAQYKLHFSVSPEHQTGPPQSNDNKIPFSGISQSSSKKEQELKTICKKNAQELSYTENKRHSGPALQNEWSDSQNTSQMFDAVTSMEPCRTSNNTDANADKDCGYLYNTGCSFNDKLDERQSPPITSHKSFTKHFENVDSIVMPYTSLQQSDEPPSPSQRNSVDYTRRRLHSGSNQSGNNPIHGRAEVKQRTSVLEKISKIEQREHESKKSQASVGSIYGLHSAPSLRGTNNRASVNSIEDIRNRFNSQDHVQGVESRRPSQTDEKLIGTQLLKRAGSTKLGDAQKTKVESKADKRQETNNEQCVLQTLPDSDKRTVDSQTMPNKEDHWQSASQDTLGFNTAYRNSIKDAQSKVLEATSYRRKDLEISPPQYKKQGRSVHQRTRPTSAIVYSRSPVSPHAPKERHSITPTDNFVKNRESQSQEGTGVPLQVARIGARKRLTTEQKKRSYSEPEKMNEVGVSDNELPTTSIQKRGQNISFLEQTVADRRKMFERDGKASSTVNLSKPELKQLQQNALADYIERKTGRRPSSQEPEFLKERSQSTYFSGSLMDSQSISSTSSMNSLQEHNVFRTRDSSENLLKIGCISSTLPPGLTGLFDLVNLEKKSDYPESRGRASSFVHQRLQLESRSKNELKIIPTNLSREVTSSKPTEFLEVSREATSDKATLAQYLVEKLPQPASLHVRSRSSPAGENRSLDFGVKHEMFLQNVSHASTSTGFRSSRGKSEDSLEKAKHEPAFSIYTAHHPSPGGEKQAHPLTHTIPMGIQNHTRAQSLTAMSGLYNHLRSGRMNTVTSINPNASKITHVSYTHNAKDFVATEGILCPPKNMDISPVKNKTMDLSSHSNSLVNNNNEKLKTKSSPPQRPQLLKTKSIDSGNLPPASNSGSVIEISPSVPWQNSTMWSTSSSEPETPSHHGKISLRISESCLQSSSPAVVHDDEDDEVFVKEQESETFPEKPFVPPSPPPFPPPSLEDALLRENQENIHLSAASFKKTLNDRHPILVEGAENRDREDRTFNLSNSNLPVNNLEVCQTQIPQFSTSSQGPSQGSFQYPHIEDGATSSKALAITDHKISTYESTLSHANTKVMTPEDVKSQELAKEIINIDTSLADILDPELKMKTTMDLMGGLFVKNSFALRENNRRWIKERKFPDGLHSAENEMTDNKKIPAENGVRSPMYYSMSAPESELLKRITNIHTEGAGGAEHLDVNEKKAELINSLNHKLEILKYAKESLLTDIKFNNSLGEEMEALVENLCKPNEFDKYKMFIGDLDKVVNLLLSISGRLAKVENVLSTLGEPNNAEEWNTWNEKKKQLCGQHEDARELKENLDRREKLVTDILGNYLTCEQHQDYQHFVKMKSALLIEQRELDDKIKLGHEQLNCLLESLPRDFVVSRKVPSASSRNVKMLPPLITSL